MESSLGFPAACLLLAHVCVVGAVTYLSAVCSDSSTLAATFPSCPGFGMAGSVVEAFIIQPSQ